MADEIFELDDNERLLLKASIDDIIADTPKTELGVIRFKKCAAKEFNNRRRRACCVHCNEP